MDNADSGHEPPPASKRPLIMVSDVELKIVGDTASSYPSRFHLTVTNQGDAPAIITAFFTGARRYEEWPPHELPSFSNSVRFLPRLELGVGASDRFFVNVRGDAFDLLSYPEADIYGCLFGRIEYRWDVGGVDTTKFGFLHQPADSICRYLPISKLELEQIGWAGRIPHEGQHNA